MITDILASSILTASLTGAGIILAVFGIVFPIIHYLAEINSKETVSKKNELYKQITKATKTLKEEDSEKIKEIAEELASKLQLPSFLSKTIILGGFVFYILSALLAYWWLTKTSPTWVEDAIGWTFVPATLALLYSGYSLISYLLNVSSSVFKEKINKTNKKSS